MPNRTVYIRKEDINRWDNILDKPAWLHICLNNGFTPLKGVLQLLDAARFDDKCTIRELRDYLIEHSPQGT